MMAKEIVLKSLNLRNFKGIKDLHIDFSRITNIFGDNGTGKTTIADAFMWLLFDKDSQDRATFEIKTLDSNNEPIHGLEHEVTGVLSVDGKEIILGKIYKEKWTKRRGEAEKQLTGHETLYSINEDPVKKSEYQETINSIINENLFKLITNPLYFSTNMKWQDRRNVLLDIIGDITTEKIINYKSDLKPLGELLNDTDIDTLSKSIKARKRKLNDEIKAIPIRIDEANNSIQELDFDALEFQKRGIVTGIKSLEEQLMDSSKVNDEVLKEKDKLYTLRSKLKDIEYKAREEAESPLRQLNKELQDALNEENRLKSDLSRMTFKISNQESIAKDIEIEMQKLREEWSLINQEALHISNDSFICPTCKRPFEEHDIDTKKEEMQENFNQSKAKRLGNINATGKKHKERLEGIKAELETLENEKNSILIKLEEIKSETDARKTKVDNFKTTVNLDSQEYKDTLSQIETIEAKLSAPAESNRDTAELKERKRTLELELDQLNKNLACKNQNEKLETRIAELQEEEKKLAQQIAALEGQEYLCEEFIKTKVELLESSINSKFKYVKFRLFKTQVNGGIEEDCEPLINGVPFSTNLNSASKINAGLDIINALSEHYQVVAPIFIDNRESVNQLIETDSQVINLIVNKDTNLRIERQISILEEAREIGEKFGIKYEEVEEI